MELPQYNAEPPLTTNNWADLPKDVLLHLCNHLDARNDVPRLRAVCPSWRTSLPLDHLPNTYPGGNLPPILRFGTPLILFESRFYLLSPTPPSPLSGKWVARVADCGVHKLKLCNPLKILTIYFATTPHVLGEINFLDCNLLELSKAFTLFCRGSEIPRSRKVVGVWHQESEKFTLLALLHCGELLLWRRGWFGVELDQAGLQYVHDMVYYKGCFYVFDNITWTVSAVVVPDYSGDCEADSPSLPRMGAPKVDGRHMSLGGGRLFFVTVVDGVEYVLGGVHFVPAENGLYLVIVGTVYEGSGVLGKRTMLVYVLNEGEKWERVRCLGDQVLFIGKDVAFSLPLASKNLPQWKAGSICLFVGGEEGAIVERSGKMMPEGMKCIDHVNYPWFPCCFELFNLDEEEKGLVLFEDLSKEVYTGLFFPPPPWVTWRCPGRGEARVQLDGLKF